MRNRSITKFLSSLFDFVLPRFCASCKAKLELKEYFVCGECISRINTPSDGRLKAEFIKKFSAKNYIEDFYSLYIFEKEKELQHIIHAMKYQNKFKIGFYFGKLLGESIINLKKWKIDIAIPIPLHHLKRVERGYNQSHYIAKGVSTALNCKEESNLIKRTRATKSQTTLTLLEREKNIEDAFTIKSKKRVTNKFILLIDDVITTGATINECAKTLHEWGAGKVYAASIAIAD